MTRILYRIDRREFSVGKEILPPGDHIDFVETPLQAAEALLRRVAGDRAKLRSEYLFVFKDLNYTGKYFLGKGGRSIYEVEVDESDILHEADMMLVNEIADVISDTPAAESLAERWLNQETRDSERVEVVVAKAVVKRKLFKPGDGKKIYDAVYVKKIDLSTILE